MHSTQIRRWVFKPILHVLCLLPLLHLIAGSSGFAGVSLGADPIAKVLHELGQWGLRFLVATLAITPLRLMLGKPWLVSFRRILGLYSFAYVLMHFIAWLAIDQGLYWQGILEDIGKRPFITIGFAALLLLIPLAITSTNRMMLRLGRHWKKLHRLIYIIAVLGVWHFYWLVKKDVTEPLIYVAIVAFLLAYRYWRFRRRKIPPVPLVEQRRNRISDRLRTPA
ncbi:MAG TPA: protein-methionine-sulfoxide reductase heme-binding subunit MsrQ [Pseudomonadales bacterium]|nr:protein-methionine-sulfoxide reductase heme-binding subunit MsrQ [Pseudomonadales bacterium]